MSLRGVVRGRTIELEEDPHLPDGTKVEVALRTSEPDPLWGLLSDQPELLQRLHDIVQARSCQRWRTPDDETGSA